MHLNLGVILGNRKLGKKIHNLFDLNRKNYLNFCDVIFTNFRDSGYLRQPCEGLPGLQKGQLMLVVRGIFGRKFATTFLATPSRYVAEDRLPAEYFGPGSVLLLQGGAAGFGTRSTC